MVKLQKKFIFILLIALFVAVTGFSAFNQNTTIDIDIDEESINCYIIGTTTDTSTLEEIICDYVKSESYNPKATISSIKEGIVNISSSYGLNNVNVNIHSYLGEDTIPLVFDVDGTSMIPTLNDGQTIVVEKTKNISVNDLVTANTSDYGVIVKRVGKIDGNNIYLESDNKNIEYKKIDGKIYEVKGITTWTDISNIYGVVRIY